MGDRRLEIVLAPNAGFCMGVRRALKLTLEAAHGRASPRPIATLGPLIHNRQVLAVLEGKGITALDGAAHTQTGTVIVRAHGISPAEHERLGRGAQRIIDATCPHVRKVQRTAREYCARGYHCIIVGDPGHAEVEAVLKHAEDRGVVVSSPQDVERLPAMDKVVVVSQTTQDVGRFAQIVDVIRRRYPDCEVFDTICRSTGKRQDEARRLAEQVCAMVVVGGFHSANTRRLARVCAQTGTPTFHVETDQELDLDRLLECRRIGVTAGASTPHWMIRRVLQRIRSEHERRRRSLAYWLRLILAVPIRTNLFVGGAAAAITYTSVRLMGIPNPRLIWCMGLSLLFITAQHLLNQYNRREAMYLNEPDRGEFFRENAGALGFLGVASGALALFLAALLGWLPFALILAGTVGSVLYGLSPGGGILRGFPVRALHQVPGSKELFVGVAWAVTAVFVPALAAGALPDHWRQTLLAVLFTFLLAFHRTLLGDLADIEGDQLLGRESLALVLGERACKGLMAGVVVLEAVLLLAGALLGWTSPAVGYLLLIAIGYSSFWSLQFHRGRLPEAELGEALVDAKFYLCGLLALLGAALG